MVSLLEVLRISTVVDNVRADAPMKTFGSTKNFYCCRYPVPFPLLSLLEVLRISTVVDFMPLMFTIPLLEVLRISTVVDLYFTFFADAFWKY